MTVTELIKRKFAVRRGWTANNRASWPDRTEREETSAMHLPGKPADHQGQVERAVSSDRSASEASHGRPPPIAKPTFFHDPRRRIGFGSVFRRQGKLWV